MAQHRTALSILVIVAVQSTVGQVMMVSPMVAAMRRHPNQNPPMRVVRPIFQPAALISRPAYTIAESPVQAEPKEPIDEQRLQARIKELEILKQDIAHKQIELDDKIAILEEQVISCHKQINEDHAVLRKLEELDRLHSNEQMQLEQMIQQQRMLQYRDRMEQERLARQREAVEEWNNAQKERQKEENSEVARVEEPPTTTSSSETPSTTQQDGDSNSEVQIQRPVSRFQEIHLHDHPDHSTSIQVQRTSKDQKVTPGTLTSTATTEVMKRVGVGAVPTTLGLTNSNVTSQRFERKPFGYDVAEKKK